MRVENFRLNLPFRPVAYALGRQFWFHGLRNAFITGRKGVDAAVVADQAVGEPRAAGRRDRRLSRGLDGGALREPAERIADRIYKPNQSGRRITPFRQTIPTKSACDRTERQVQARIFCYPHFRATPSILK